MLQCFSFEMIVALSFIYDVKIRILPSNVGSVCSATTGQLVCIDFDVQVQEMRCALENNFFV